MLYRCDPHHTDAQQIDSYSNHLYNTALPQLQLECLGVADNPRWLRAIMETPMAAEQKFKLLHIRRTGSPAHWDHMQDQWRFGYQIDALVKHNPRSWSRDDYLQQMKEGNVVFLVALSLFQSPKFNNLQLLAFGDCSHGNRFEGRNLLLCRAVTRNPEVNFRVMSRHDTAFYRRTGVLSLDFLAACPKDSLL